MPIFAIRYTGRVSARYIIIKETEIKILENTISMPPSMPPSTDGRNPNMPSTCPAMTVTMAYVPLQKWETPYDEMTALSRGTIFPSLDKPFVGGRTS